MSLLYKNISGSISNDFHTPYEYETSGEPIFHTSSPHDRVKVLTTTINSSTIYPLPSTWSPAQTIIGPDTKITFTPFVQEQGTTIDPSWITTTQPFNFGNVFNQNVAVVTGYAGFIGSHFTRRLLNDGWFVYGIDLDHNSEAAIELEAHPNFEVWADDIVEVKSLPDCDYVFNFAAETHVSNSIEDSVDFVRSNIDGVRNLLELIRKKPNNVVKKPIFFQISTDEVYGDAGETLRPKTWTNAHVETDLLNPSNPYAATKAAADMLVLAWARTYDIEYVIARPTNNYGTHQNAEKLIPLTTKLLKWGQQVRLHNGGHPVRCWLNVLDTADAILKLVNEDARGIYNISGPDQYTNRMIVALIMHELGIHNQQEWLDLNHVRPGQDMRYAIDDTKLKQLGWTPKHLIADELSGIIQWYLQDIRRRLF